MLEIYLCLAMFSRPVWGQLSPGPLSAAHRELEGVTKCAACHDFGQGARGFKCLDCHGEIKRELDAHSGYHTRLYKTTSRQTDCARCHMEHNGQKFSLVRFDRKAFDHRAETGYLLEGKHRTEECSNCHNAKHIAANARSGIQVKDLNRTFLGLRRECLTCHVEPHGGRLGADCLRCHNQDAWKPAAGFNHAKTRFALTGLHQAVQCFKCHVPKAGEKTPAYSGVVFAGCQNCHTDPHRGAFQAAKFRGTCATCHNTGGWKKNRPSGNFEHGLTKFPLVQAHEQLACAKCHRDSDFHRAVNHQRCQDCHTDPHSGQFEARTAGSDCASCHTQTKFKPALFSRELHQQSKFRLEGKHIAVECSKCHKPEGKATVYLTGKLQCAECHEDRHKAAFVAAPYNGRCDSCHTVDDFKQVKFDRPRHVQTRFPLTGKHITVECSACHKPTATPTAMQYRFASQSCQSCHKDPHETKLSCETCHTNEGWKPAGAFDHSATKFPLDASHQKATCGQCHRAPKAPLFARTPNQCAACHEDKQHGGQFTADCATCHVTVAWKEVTFDHDNARFPLDRAHRNVACAKCHKLQPGLVTKYRGTPLECTKCH